MSTPTTPVTPLPTYTSLPSTPLPSTPLPPPPLTISTTAPSAPSLASVTANVFPSASRYSTVGAYTAMTPNPTMPPSPLRDIIKTDVPMVQDIWSNTIFKTLFHVGMGFFIGMAIEQIVGKIFKSDKKTDPSTNTQTDGAWKRMITQMVLNVVILVAMQKFLPTVVNDWVNSATGLFFPAILFSVQSQMFSDFNREVANLW